MRNGCVHPSRGLRVALPSWSVMSGCVLSSSLLPTSIVHCQALLHSSIHSPFEVPGMELRTGGRSWGFREHEDCRDWLRLPRHPLLSGNGASSNPLLLCDLGQVAEPLCPPFPNMLKEESHRKAPVGLL